MRRRNLDQVPVTIFDLYWLRLSRQTNSWTCSVSTDGQNYSTIDTFTQPLTLNRIGPWAGNLGTAFTARIDYFANAFSSP